MSIDPEEQRKIAKNWREYLKETRESLRVCAWVWKELISVESRKWTKWALALSFAQMTVFSLTPFALVYVIDGLVAHDRSEVIIGIGGFFACSVISRLIGYFKDCCVEIVAGENMVHIDQRTTELFFEKSLGQHQRDDGTLTFANVEKGRAHSHEIANLLIFDGIQTTMELLVVFILLFVMAPIVGVIMAAALATYLLWMVFLNRKTTEVCTPIDAEFRAVNRYRVERWDGIERVKTSGKELEEARTLKRRFLDVLLKDRRYWLWFLRMTTLRGLINTTAVVCVLAYIAWNVWSGAWTVGFFWPVFRWAQQASENLWKVGSIEHNLNRRLPSIQSMRAALSTPPDVISKPGALVLPDAPIRVEVDGVTHRYSQAASVLRGIRFAIDRGEKVALLGPSGAGKTTIMRLLLRYFDPSEGAVKVNGHDLRDIDLESWRALVAYIPQSAHIFDGTIRDNLLYALPEDRRCQVTDAQLQELMRTLKIDFGKRLSEGLDTIVGRRGIKLSGGEAQRLMIGAAIVKSPRFLIVDEATSSLDSTTEREVQEGIERVIQASTSALIITHRLQTVRNLCTKFVVLRPSDKLGEGEEQIEAVASSFEELYAISPTFRRLADDQGVNIEPISGRSKASVTALKPSAEVA